MANRGDQGDLTTLSVVRDALIRGEFERCHALCDAYRPKNSTEATEIVLLRARCLIPLGRGENAIQALTGLRTVASQHDEYLRGRALMSAAYMSIGQPLKSLNIALDAQHVLGEANSDVRSELLFAVALGHYRTGEHVRAQRLFDSVSPTAGIVYARALEYSGWLAWANGNYSVAVDRFRDALHQIDGCDQYDRFIEAECLFGLTVLCAELPRVDVWPEVSLRVTRFDWTLSGVAIWRFWIALSASQVAELCGDGEASTAWIVIAEQNAADLAARIHCWCRLAARFGRYGESNAHAYWLNKAHAAYETLPRNAHYKEQRSLPLIIAEEMVYGYEPSDAGPLLTFFKEAIMPTMGDSGEERQIQAFYASVLGQYEERRGNRARAEDSYLRAFEAYRFVGFSRRASIVANRLFAMTADRKYEQFVANALRDASEKYWVKARMARSQIEARLTTTQLEVLLLVAEGLSNKEIAKARGVSYYTARNSVGEILSILGVQSRTELARVAASRGLLRPTN